MATPTSGQVGGPRKGAGSTTQVKRSYGEGARDDVLKSLGLEFKNLQKGSATRKAAETIAKQFEGAGKVDESSFEAAKEKLQAAIATDATASIDLPNLDHGKDSLPKAFSDGNFIQAKDGKNILHPSLSGADHVVGKLLRALGLSANDLPANAADVINEIIKGNGAGSTLSDKSFEQLKQQLSTLSPKVAARRDPVQTSKTKGAARVQAQKTENKEKPSDAQTTDRVRVGEAMASETTGAGNTNSAMHALIGNLAQFQKGKKESQGVAKIADQVAETVAKDVAAQGGKLNAAHKKIITDTVKGVFDADPAMKDGNVRMTDVVANTWAQLAAHELGEKGDAGIFGSMAQMADGIRKAVNDPSAPDKTDGLLARTAEGGALPTALDELAAEGLARLIQTKLGGEPMQIGDATKGKMVGIFGNLVDKTEAKKFSAEIRSDTTEAKTIAKGKEAIKARAEGKIKPEHRAQAENYFNQLKQLSAASGVGHPIDGIDAKSPQGKQVIAAFAKVLGESKNSEEAIGKACDLIRADLGVLPRQVEAFLPPSGKQAQIDQLDKQIASLANAERPDAAKEAAALGKLRDDIKAELEQSKAMVMAELAAYAAAPEAYAQIRNVEPQGARGPRQFDPHKIGDMSQFAPTGYGVPGLTGTGSAHGNPRDGNDKKAMLYAQRSFVVSSILNDPCLSIEDKIFLFMMWFAAFADEERKLKMEELAELDRQDADKHKALQGAELSLKNKVETGDKLQGEARELKDQLEQAKKDGGDPSKIESLEKQFLEKTDQVKSNETSTRALQADIDRLKTETQEAPKSREVLLFELDRITQLRGNIMDMARHFLEDSHRRIKEIMR